jgi:hypothetical protein
MDAEQSSRKVIVLRSFPQYGVRRTIPSQPAAVGLLLLVKCIVAMSVTSHPIPAVHLCQSLRSSDFDPTA